MSCLLVAVAGSGGARGLKCLAARDLSEPTSSAAVAQPVKVPRGPEETAQQALAACLRAYKGGIMKQRMELLLPLIGATDLDDWPGGVQQQFKVRQAASVPNIVRYNVVIFTRGNVRLRCWREITMFTMEMADEYMLQLFSGGTAHGGEHPEGVNLLDHASLPLKSVEQRSGMQTGWSVGCVGSEG
eukprot:scaffold648045_cov35-Prasinocladus_malaysianus.AAC.2